MTKIEVSGMVYEFSEEFGLINFLKENADRVYESSDASTNVLPPNAPLTLDELRKMDGEPVWVCLPNGSYGGWMINYQGWCMNRFASTEMYGTYGKSWLAYRRKLEEGTT